MSTISFYSLALTAIFSALIVISLGHVTHACKIINLGIFSGELAPEDCYGFLDAGIRSLSTKDAASKQAEGELLSFAIQGTVLVAAAFITATCVTALYAMLLPMKK